MHDARDPAGTREPGFCGHIVKGSVAIVLVEPIARACRRDAKARAAQHQNVEPAVVIVIEERDAATDGFKNMCAWRRCFHKYWARSGRLDARHR